MYRLRPEGPQVLLIHPGGPFWAAKDRGARSIPKGEIEEGEETLAAAMREFEEETGMRPAAEPEGFRPRGLSCSRAERPSTHGRSRVISIRNG